MAAAKQQTEEKSQHHEQRPAVWQGFRSQAHAESPVCS
ncbi:hypothetical protein TVNIR_3687 [Thioalkalivibrio nitratireducens DSM 14787]|uniref:Uncharacterized protein n=1 Tax=Thioalkalivibrio nitratireducens (strain DSM 14787 / UNIQEM 213 / ALEN2) TaxID=1255043 RepID=L0E0F5_THIND|nr:hypothetical protein TVNIR_3687 [Thioalkalivibrio nitratireducens DSM 14787]